MARSRGVREVLLFWHCFVAVIPLSDRQSLSMEILNGEESSRSDHSTIVTKVPVSSDSKRGDSNVIGKPGRHEKQTKKRRRGRL